MVPAAGASFLKRSWRLWKSWRLRNSGAYATVAPTLCVKLAPTQVFFFLNGLWFFKNVLRRVSKFEVSLPVWTRCKKILFRYGTTQAVLELRATPQLHFLRTGLWSPSCFEKQICRSFNYSSHRISRDSQWPGPETIILLEPVSLLFLAQFYCCKMVEIVFPNLT
jgi:hypothetical protein